ncbi:MAG TPA: hypothetical protein DCP91_00570 [Eggerthellaceae bacterium]|nr:hypothetical protein [Eggerthellaceae bacterium]
MANHARTMAAHAREEDRTRLKRAPRTAYLAAALVLAAIAVAALNIPADSLLAMALLLLVPFAVFAIGSALFIVSQQRHRNEIVIERGPELSAEFDVLGR